MKLFLCIAFTLSLFSQNWVKKDIDSYPLPKELHGEWYLNGEMAIAIEAKRVIFPHSKSANDFVRRTPNSFIVFEYYAYGSSSLKLIARKSNDLTVYASIILMKSSQRNSINFAKKVTVLRNQTRGLPNLTPLTSFNAERGYALLHRKAGYTPPIAKAQPKPWKQVKLPKKFNGKWFTKRGLQVYHFKKSKTIKHGKKTYTIKEVLSNSINHKIVAKVKGKKKFVTLYIKPNGSDPKAIQAGISNQLNSLEAAKKIKPNSISRYSKLRKK